MIIHILHQGRTLCGFGYGMFPGEWVAGHRWTHLNDRGNADCPECLRVAEEQSLPPESEPDRSDTSDTPDI